MAEMEFYLTDGDRAELFDFIIDNDGAFVPGLWYGKPEGIRIRSNAELMQCLDAKIISFFVISPRFQTEPLLLRGFGKYDERFDPKRHNYPMRTFQTEPLTPGQLVKEEPDGKYYLNQRYGGPYIHVSFYLGYADNKDTPIKYKSTWLSHYPSHIHYDDHEAYERFPASKELKAYYRMIAKFLKSKCREVTVNGGKKYWVSKTLKEEDVVNGLYSPIDTKALMAQPSYDFVTMLTMLISYQGIEVLKDAGRCRSVLTTYAVRDDYEAEINLFAKAMEKKFYEKLQACGNRDATKKQLAQILANDGPAEIELAENVLNCLCFALFGDDFTLEQNTFTDPRDGKTYKTVKIGTQIWMAENLNYDENGSRCYKDKPRYAGIYGRLYDWDAAVKAVPPGWHLPSESEWEILLKLAGGRLKGGFMLKAENGWFKDGNGPDYFGFSAMPGGELDLTGAFRVAGNHGCWWTASEFGKFDATCLVISYHCGFGRWFGYDKRYMFSVRCVKDQTGAASA